MAEEDRDYSDENRRRMLVALAILLGADVENRPESYRDVPAQTMKRAKEIYERDGLELAVEQPARMPEREVQIKVAEAGARDSAKLYRIVGQDDDRTCGDCARWRGKTVSMAADGAHPTVQDFINGHGFHVNCRCSLQELDVEEIPLNPLNPRYGARRAANPDSYNSCENARLVFN